MKNLNKIFLSTGSFLLGALCCYVLNQFAFLDIDRKVNVIETIVSAFSIGVGIYLVIVIQKRHNQSQNFYNYLVNRLDIIWGDFNSIYGQIEKSDQIELRTTNLYFKDFEIKHSNFKRLLSTVNIDANLEGLIENLENLLDRSLKRNNILYYDSIKLEIDNLASQINSEFVRIYQEVNKLS